MAAQEPDIKRTDLQRHDLSVAGREVEGQPSRLTSLAVARQHALPALLIGALS